MCLFLMVMLFLVFEFCGLISVVLGDFFFDLVLLCLFLWVSVVVLISVLVSVMVRMS